MSKLADALRRLLRDVDMIASGAKRSASNENAAFIDYRALMQLAGEAENARAALAADGDDVRELIEAAREEATLLDELLTAIENIAADIGGSRCTTEIIEDLGPANDALLDALRAFPAPPQEKP